MTRSRVFLPAATCSLACALILLVRAPAGAAPPPRVGVLRAELSPSIESLRAGIESAISEGAALAGANVVGTARARDVADAAGVKELLLCKAASCVQQLAKLLDIDTIIRTEVDSTRRVFSVQVRITRVSDGRVWGAESITCKVTEPCSPIQETTRDVAREAMRKTLAQIDGANGGISGAIGGRQLADRQQAAGAPPAAAVVSGAAPAPSTVAPQAPARGEARPPSPSTTPWPPSSSPPAPPTTPSSSSPPAPSTMPPPPAASSGPGGGASWGPWVAFAVAGLAVAGGAYVLTSVDGQPLSCETKVDGRVCYDVRDAAIEGWSLIGIGALAAGAGLYLVLGSDDGARNAPVVTLGPRGALLRGTF